MTRVFIIADVRLYREGLALLLGRIHGLAIVGTAAACDGAASSLRSFQPDIVLLDMATAGSLAAVREIAALPEAPKVIALAVPDAEEDLLACTEAGVAGYVTRDDSLEDVRAAIETAARGELALHAEDGGAPRAAVRTFAPRRARPWTSSG